MASLSPYSVSCNFSSSHTYVGLIKVCKVFIVWVKTMNFFRIVILLITIWAWPVSEDIYLSVVLENKSYPNILVLPFSNYYSKYLFLVKKLMIWIIVSIYATCLYVCILYTISHVWLGYQMTGYSSIVMNAVIISPRISWQEPNKFPFNINMVEYARIN